MVRIAVLLTILAISLSAAKNRIWMSGTILDSTAAEAYLGDAKPGQLGRNYDFVPKEGLQTHGRSLLFIPHYGIRETFVIEANGRRYAATRVLQNAGKPSKLADTREVKFAVEKRNVFVLDDKGREQKFKLVEKPAN